MAAALVASLASHPWRACGIVALACLAVAAHETRLSAVEAPAAGVAPSTSDAPAGADWRADHAAAVARARREGKLVLVVHLSGDFAQNSPESPEAKLYRNYILGDPQVARLVRDRFVVAMRSVGTAQCTPRVHPAPAKDTRTPAGKILPPPVERVEMAVAYICLPDERVLHFVPGFVTPAELCAELKWAEAAYARVAAEPSSAWPAGWRERHVAAVEPSDREAFASLFASRWPAEKKATAPTLSDELLIDKGAPAEERGTDHLAPEYATSDLNGAMRASLALWRFAYDQQAGQNKQFKADAALERAQQTSHATSVLAAHGSLGKNLAHLVLAEFPLVYLNDLAAPAYEACSGERFWQTSLRRPELFHWWSQCHASRRKTLLIISSDLSDDVLAKLVPPADKAAATPAPAVVSRKSAASKRAADSDTEPDDAIRRLTDEEAGLLASVWRASYQTMTAGEFAALVHDAKLEPVPCNTVVGFPRCILHDGQGFRCGELSLQEATAERLETMLRLSISSEPSGK
jgi:hypothetical protein